MRITVKPTIQIEVVLSACPYHQSPQEPPRDGKKQKNIKHSGSSDLMRLSKLLDRYGTDLELENTIKEILRTALAALLMAATLMPYMTSTVVWWNACLRTTKANMSIKDHLTHTHQKNPMVK